MKHPNNQFHTNPSGFQKPDGSFLKLGLIFLLLSAFLIQGCGVSGPRRGKLSEAMEKASDNYDGDRTVSSTENDEDEDEDESTPLFQPSTERTEYLKNRLETKDDSTNIDQENDIPEDPPLPKKVKAGVKWGIGYVGNEEFQTINHFHLTIGGYIEERKSLHFSIGLNLIDVNSDHKLSESIKNTIWVGELDLEYRGFITPDYTFFGNYFLAGIGYNLMGWNYRNPIEAVTYDDYGNIEDTEEITSDALSGGNLYFGTGFNALQIKGFHLGVELVTGVYLWGLYTSQGFENDVYDLAMPYWKMRLNLDLPIFD